MLFIVVISNFAYFFFFERWICTLKMNKLFTKYLQIIYKFLYTRYTKCISSNFVNIIFYEVFHVQIRWVVKRFKLVSYLCSPFVLIYLIRTCAKFTEKLTFLTAWYAHVHVRGSVVKIIVFQKILHFHGIGAKLISKWEQNMF